jgi:hypothetical protein
LELQGTSNLSGNQSGPIYTGELAGLIGQLKEKYFDYFVFNIINSGLPCSGVRRRALA